MRSYSSALASAAMARELMFIEEMGKPSLTDQACDMKWLFEVPNDIVHCYEPAFGNIWNWPLLRLLSSSNGWPYWKLSIDLRSNFLQQESIILLTQWPKFQRVWATNYPHHLCWCHFSVARYRNEVNTKKNENNWKKTIWNTRWEWSKSWHN